MIQERFGLDDAGEALRRVADRRAIGRLIVNP
jgi:hypothetical protein